MRKMMERMRKKRNGEKRKEIVRTSRNISPKRGVNRDVERPEKRRG